MVLQLKEQRFVFNVHLNKNVELMRVKEFNAAPKKHFHCKTSKANLEKLQSKPA